MEIRHKKLDIAAELNDFSQAQYEQYHTKMLELTRNNESAAVANGAIVRAAAHAGILKGIDAEAVGGMKPAAVMWLTRKIHEHVLNTINVPDDPN